MARMTTTKKKRGKMNNNLVLDSASVLTVYEVEKLQELCEKLYYALGDLYDHPKPDSRDFKGRKAQYEKAHAEYVVAKSKACRLLIDN